MQFYAQFPQVHRVNSLVILHRVWCICIPASPRAKVEPIRSKNGHASPKMRYPVFSKGSNVRVDKPIVRKKMAYLEAQVASFVADWVDEGDHSRGIVAREFLPREIAYTAVQMKRDSHFCRYNKTKDLQAISH